MVLRLVIVPGLTQGGASWGTYESIENEPSANPGGVVFTPFATFKKNWRAGLFGGSKS